jgi:Xaa-Pro aminopeptidase
MKSGFTLRLAAAGAWAALCGATSLAAQIAPGEYQARRDSLAAAVDSGVVLAFGGRTPVTDFGPFFQLPAFHYLTGYDYADATLIMVVRDGHGTSTLFVHRSTPRRALYYGEEPDSQAIAGTSALASRPAEALAGIADSLAASGQPFYTLRDVADADFAAADSLTRGGSFVRTLLERYPGLTVRDAYPLVNRLRARKSSAELALIRTAAEISAAGHRAAMRAIAPHMHEFDLQAVAEYTFRRLGSERPSYGSIVGAGPDGTQLHYMQNRREMQAGELVVIDAGAEYGGYAGDVTRTLPVSGTYSPNQRSVYQVVLDAEKAAERNVGPGRSIQAAQDSSLDVRARGLARLGLVESPTATMDPPWPADCERTPRACLQAQLFAIHGISHGLGLAVHDVTQAEYGDHTLQPGDAFTIEPGIYVTTKLLDILPLTAKNLTFIARVRRSVEKYRDTGVRIEDDYIVTDRGAERLTADAPREMADIETLIKRRAVPAPEP